MCGRKQAIILRAQAGYRGYIAPMLRNHYLALPEVFIVMAQCSGHLNW
ncbi:hypothetical protein BN133_2611 [Cronobacter dublinensis 582]|nr:hypothetical protein BN133_2611 [Cronobacter dublinensis 582]